jgi:hypothetical protein
VVSCTRQGFPHPRSFDHAPGNFRGSPRRCWVLPWCTRGEPSTSGDIPSKGSGESEVATPTSGDLPSKGSGESEVAVPTTSGEIPSKGSGESEVAAALLFALDGLEQRLEVALAEAE